ncbi:hypothetical protein U9M48_041749, partial [Paspalum notatum var. saurae]
PPLFFPHFPPTRITNSIPKSSAPPPPLLPPAPCRRRCRTLPGEVFLRLPSDDLACLLRASLTCRRWRRILADPAFRRRHGGLHRMPAVLGLFHIVTSAAPYLSRYVPVNTASRRPAGRDLPGWFILDCRHGRALFATPSPSLDTHLALDLLVWDPLTGEQRHLPRPSPPPTANLLFNAAVLCAAGVEEGCDHRGCHGGAFRVVYLFTRWTRDGMYATSARVYSSETGSWSKRASVRHLYVQTECTPSPSAYVGDALYFRGNMSCAFEYQLGTHRLSVVNGPRLSRERGKFISLVSLEDGGLLCTDMELRPSPLLRLWSRESGPDGVARWARGRGFELETLLPNGALLALPLLFPMPNAAVVGFAEGTDVIFVATRPIRNSDAVYMVQLNSGKVTKVLECCTMIFPYTSFCIPVIDAACTGKGAGEGVSSA